MKRALLAMCLIGCGRIGFDATVPGGDGAPALGHCGATGTAPDPITISGHTFRYTNVNNSVADVPGAHVQALAGGTTLAETTSDAQGAYSLTLATGGDPVPLQLVYAPTGYMASTIWLDAPLDHDLDGAPSPYVWPGDAPVWNDAAMDSVYMYPMIVRSPSAATVQIAVRDCSGAPVANVAVTSSRGGTLAYIDSDGIAKTALVATQAMYAVAIYFNAEVGPTTFTFSGGGLTWPALAIDVLAGENVTLALVRGDP